METCIQILLSLGRDARDNIQSNLRITRNKRQVEYNNLSRIRLGY